MKQSVWRTYAFWIVLAEAVGALSGWLSREGMALYSETIVQPALMPPAVVFPIVWTILYALMGVGAARISLQPKSRERDRAMNLFIAQLVVNFFWSLFFFNAQAFGFSLLWLALLWVLIFFMIRAFWKVDETAAKLQIPYLVWVTFAGVLNLAVWLLNR